MDNPLTKRREADQRIPALNRRWRALQRVIDERAADPASAKVPGGSTGLLIIRERVIGIGEKQRTVVDGELDTDLLREMLAIEKQAAMEMGQWTERREVEAAVTNERDAR